MKRTAGYVKGDIDGVSTLIVILSLLVTALTNVTLVLLKGNTLSFVIIGLITAVGCFVTWLLSESFEDLFAFELIPIVYYIAFSLMQQKLKVAQLPAPDSLLVCAIVVFSVTFLFATLFTMIAGTIDSLAYPLFFRRSTIFFAISYIYLSMRYLFVQDSLTMLGMPQFIPFGTFVAYVSALVNGSVRTSVFVLFIASRLLIFLPYGFVLSYFLSRVHIYIRTVVLFLLPLITELVRFVLDINRFDIDSVIFGFAGAMAGLLCYSLLNDLCIKNTGKMLTGKEPERDYFSKKMK
ncbi:MAG: VanZ family protein [Lachnospiraceae bacterium]|nr:VanZ family protein [Lachnospiraceae bacterium]